VLYPRFHQYSTPQVPHRLLDLQKQTLRWHGGLYAPHQQLAKSFYEFVTTEASLLHAAKTYWRIPTRSDLDFSKFSPETDPRNFPPLQLDWQLFADSSEIWMQYWDANIRNQGTGGTPAP